MKNNIVCKLCRVECHIHYYTNVIFIVYTYEVYVNTQMYQNILIKYMRYAKYIFNMHANISKNNKKYMSKNTIFCNYNFSKGFRYDDIILDSTVTIFYLLE